MSDVHFKKFYLGEIIDPPYKAKAYRIGDIQKLEDGDDPFNYVSRSDQNNGCSMIVHKKLSHYEKENAITIGDTTSTIFYQDNNFICGDHIVVIRANWMNENRALYICSCLQKERFKYSYGRAFNIDYIKKTPIFLPTNSNDEIDWSYIDAFIETFKESVNKKKDKIIEVSKNDYELISTLSGGVNAIEFEKWANNDKGKEEIALRNLSDWAPFYVVRNGNHKGILDVQSCKCGNASALEEGDDVFYRGAKKTNNGVMKRVAANNSLMTKGNCIFFVCDGDGSCGYTNYVEDDFIGSTTTSVGYDSALNPTIALFLVTILDLEKYKYSHGRKYRTNLEKTIIYLPAKKAQSGEFLIDNNSKYSDNGYIPDWEYIEEYLSSLPFSDKINNERS